MDHVTNFIAYKTIEVGLSDITLETYQRILREFCLSIGERDPAGAGETEIRAHIAACWDEGVKPSSVAQRVSCLREFFKHLQRDGFIQRNPMTRIPMPKLWKRLPKAKGSSGFWPPFRLFTAKC